MRRNWNTIREILLKVEELPPKETLRLKDFADEEDNSLLPRLKTPGCGNLLQNTARVKGQGN